MSGDGVDFAVDGKRLTRAAIIHPRTGFTKSAGQTRDSDAALNEAVGLALAIDLEIAFAQSVAVDRPHPRMFLGRGKVDELKGALKADDVELLIFNGALSPAQQRNLERALDVKVVDRTGLILEIFGRRARTKEGRLQVDLAHLNYQKSRLVRSWTHLERQRGALGFVGGPGETQIEADRRMLRNRIKQLTRQLEKVRRTRSLHRASRQKVPYPVIALVGYTNAGKSTLFNALTRAEVRAEDLLFATLDPTMRALDLPGGMKVILSDTVGFISDLPVDLVAAFRATLEEVREADLIVHVRDIAHDDTAAQNEDVHQVLAALEIDEAARERMIEVWNKLDLLDKDAAELARTRAARSANVVAVSALTGDGLGELLDSFEAALGVQFATYRVLVAPEEGKALNWLYENCEVMLRTQEDDGASLLEVRVPENRLARFKSKFTRATAINGSGAGHKTAAE